MPLTAALNEDSPTESETLVPTIKALSTPASAAENALKASSSRLVTEMSVTEREITERTTVRITAITRSTTKRAWPFSFMLLGRNFDIDILSLATPYWLVKDF